MPVSTECAAALLSFRYPSYLPIPNVGFIVCFSLGIFPNMKRRPMRKRKHRPLFSPHQIQTMELKGIRQTALRNRRQASSSGFRGKLNRNASENSVPESTNKVEKGNKR